MMLKSKNPAKKMLRTILISVLLLSLIGYAGAAQAGESTMDPALFDLALQEDRLALVPADVSMTLQYNTWAREMKRFFLAMAPYGYYEDATVPSEEKSGSEWPLALEGKVFYELVSIVSISPDGQKALVYLDDLLAVWNRGNNDICFVAPGEGIDQGQVDGLMRLIQGVGRPVDTSVAWSPDGEYLSLCFMRQVVMNMNFGVNAWIVSTSNGEAKPIVPELPAKVSILHDKPFDVPYRAAFSENSSGLYYETISVLADGERSILVNLYDIETGVSQPVDEYDYETLTSDPHLWVTPYGVVHNFSHRSNHEDCGVMIMAPDGMSRRVIAGKNYDGSIFMRFGHLVDVKGAYAVYLDIARYGQGETALEKALSSGMVCFSLEDTQAGALDALLYIRPLEKSSARIVRLTAEEIMGSKVKYGKLFENEQLLSPYNGALSPDGRYLLLATGKMGDSSFYVYDLERGECGQVIISALYKAEGTVYPAYQSNMNRQSSGLQWVGENQIMVYVGGGYRLYDWGAAQ